jgi:hypothetical protein
MKAHRYGLYMSVPAQMSRSAGNICLGRAFRQEVIDRWSECTGHVRSVNGITEASEIASLIHNIEIIPIEDERRVKITNITNLAKSQDHDVTIIANADCLPFDTKFLREIIEQVGSNDLCLLQRSNLRPKTLNASKQNFIGVDGFVLGREALAKLPTDAEWRIGDPCWDFWLPFLLHDRGCNVYGIKAHALIHLDHAAKWNFNDWLAKARRLLAEIPPDNPAWGKKINRIFGRRSGKHLSNLEIQFLFAFISSSVVGTKRDIFINPESFNAIWMGAMQRAYGPMGSHALTPRHLMASGMSYIASFIQRPRQP